MIDADLVSPNVITARIGNLLFPSSSFDGCKLFFRHPVASREVALYLGQPYNHDRMAGKIYLRLFSHLSLL